MGWTRGTHGAEKCTQAFGGDAEGMRPLGRPMTRWKDMAMDCQEAVSGHGLDCSGSG